MVDGLPNLLSVVKSIKTSEASGLIPRTCRPHTAPEGGTQRLSEKTGVGVFHFYVSTEREGRIFLWSGKYFCGARTGLLRGVRGGWRTVVV